MSKSELWVLDTYIQKKYLSFRYKYPEWFFGFWIATSFLAAGCWVHLNVIKFLLH